jgi:hypothetical protein
MKKLSALFVFLLITSLSFAQTSYSRAPVLDKSPMDMAYYPVNFPVLKIQEKVAEPLVARVIYSRPQKSGRTVFGELVEFGQVWRLGANEATEIEFYRDVKIGGKKIVKGKYTLYAQVQPTEWTIIFNKETDTWGAFKYDPKKDVARIKVPVVKTEDTTEAYTMYFEKQGTGIQLIMHWDNVRVALPMALK